MSKVVRVEKSYYTDTGDITLYGTFAGTVEEFEERLKTFSIQTTDPRIDWDEEPDGGWEYIDFSFGLVKE